MIHLTTLPPPASGADPVSAIIQYDGQRPDGLTKEIVARAAALALLNPVGDADALAGLHDSLDPVVAAAVKSGAGVVNPVVKRIVVLNALHVPVGLSESDATAALAGAVYDVVNQKPLTISAMPASLLATGGASTLFKAASAATPDLTGLDLLSADFEPLRLVLTRTLMAVRPDLYDQYRQIKDGGGATAREDAYEFAFGVLAKLIEKSPG